MVAPPGSSFLRVPRRFDATDASLVIFSEWKSGNVLIIAATVPLGMWIDKKDVLFIWLLGTPSAIERAF